MELNYSLKDLKELVQDASVQGSTALTIRSIASLEEARPGDLSFLANNKYRSKVKNSLASVILVPESYEDSEPKADQVYIKTKNPSYALAQICQDIERKLCPPLNPGIDPSARVDPSAKVSPKAYIGPFCMIGAEAVIEEGAHLSAYNFVGRGAL
ncbi:MAG: LpxD N-terminal domain-containing protein, partial [Bdellovibrionota bacterium]